MVEIGQKMVNVVFECPLRELLTQEQPPSKIQFSAFSKKSLLLITYHSGLEGDTINFSHLTFNVFMRSFWLKLDNKMSF